MQVFRSQENISVTNLCESSKLFRRVNTHHTGRLSPEPILGGYFLHRLF